MNNRVSELYQSMLKEVQGELKTAENLFLHMSNLVLELMRSDSMVETKIRELRNLDHQHRELLSEIVRELNQVCPGRIKLYPPAGGGFLEDLERRNAQSEELERIVKSLLKESSFPVEEKRDEKLEERSRRVMENVDCRAEFERKFVETETIGQRPNILVAGYSGSGKSALIQTIFGRETAAAVGIYDARPSRIEFESYENDYIRLWDSRSQLPGEKEANYCRALREFIAELQDDPSVEEHIHLVWYLIQGNDARVTECDRALIRNVFPSGHVIVLISKKDITEESQSAAIRRELLDAGVPAERIVEVSDAESGAIGCRELVALSRRMLPDAYRDAFLSAQQVDREAKARWIRDKAESAGSIVAAAAGEAREIAGQPLGQEQSLLACALAMAAELASLYGLRESGFHETAVKFVNLAVTSREESLPKSEISGEMDGASAAMRMESLGRYLKYCFEARALAKVRGSLLSAPGLDFFSYRQFRKNYRKERSMKANILVCGKTGVGKTSLIQAVTHRGVVPDSAIGDGKPVTKGFQLYETEAANFIDSEGMNPGTQTVDEYADFILGEALQRLDDAGEERLIHNIWYCIDGSGGRVQDADARLIKTCSGKVILAVTKSELMRREQLEAMMNELLDLITRDRIAVVSAENRTGLSQLIAKAEAVSEAAMGHASEELEAFRRRWDGYYENMRRVWSESVSSEADSYISWAAGRAAAIALVPLPLADVTPLIANEIYMLYKLAGVYGIAADNTLVTMLLGCAGGSIAGKIGASFLPFLKVPIAAAVTYGVGKAAKAYFESDMTMNEEELRQEFLAGEREAKKKDWKKTEEEAQ